MARAPIAAPTPIPAWAAVLSPPDGGLEDVVEVPGGVVVAAVAAVAAVVGNVDEGI
jgi:hypothetical protein